MRPMAKRRTKNDKIKAHHSIQVSWEPGTINNNTEAGVNRQNKLQTQNENLNRATIKNANNEAQEAYLRRTKKDIFRSLGLVIVIISIELVLYFAWKV